MTETGEEALGFALAALAPAAATGLIFIGLGGGLAGPGGFGGTLFLGAVAFVAALFIAGLHIGLLAVPLHMLLSRRGTPGPGAVLASATLIGALPIPLLFQGGGWAFMIFGVAGLIGGIAFLMATWRPAVEGEDW
jgi:hypothetical protein